jgi:hypothetical protein
MWRTTVFHTLPNLHDSSLSFLITTTNPQHRNLCPWNGTTTTTVCNCFTLICLVVHRTDHHLGPEVGVPESFASTPDDALRVTPRVLPPIDKLSVEVADVTVLEPPAAAELLRARRIIIFIVVQVASTEL